MDVFDLYAKISLDTSGYESGLQDASKTTQSFGTRLSNGFKAAGKLAATAMAAIGTATVAATGAFVAGAKEVAAYGDNIDKMSQKMGMSAEAYQEWDAVMQHSGTSMETMKAGMKTLANAVESGNEAFQRIGLTQEELAKMSQEDIFAATIAGLQNVEDVTERTYLAGQLLGRGATELGALLNTSAEETQAMRDRVHELGGVMSDEAVKASAQFQDNLQDMTTAMSGIKRAITGDLLPGLNLVMEGFTSLLVGEEGGVEAFDKGFHNIIDTVGGATERVFEIVGKIGPTIFDTLLESLPEAFNFGMELVSSVVNGITEHTGDIVGAASKLVDVFSANAGGWIDAGSQLIIDVITGVTQAIPQLITSVSGAVKTIVEKVTDPKNANEFLKSGLNMIKSLVSGIVKGAPSVIREIPVIIGNVLTIIREGLPEVISTVTGLFEELVSQLPDIITSLLEALPSILTMVVNTLSESLPVLIDGVTSLVISLSTHLPEIIQALISAIPSVIQSVIDAAMTLVPALVQGAIQLVTALIPYTPEIIKALILAIPDIIEAIIQGFSPLLGQMVALFSEIGSAISDWWSGKKQDIANGWADFIANVKLWFNDLPYNLGLALGDMIANLGDWIIEAETWVETELPGLINAIVEWFKGLPGRIWEWLVEVVNKFTTWREEGQKRVDEEIPKLIDGIAKFFEELPEKALTWGKDMIAGFIEGIGTMAEEAWNAVSDFAQGIADRLGFSEPELGPLSNFHTYAPDMMKLFAEGVTDNTDIVTDAIEDAFDFSNMIVAPEVDYQRAYQNDTGAQLAQMVALLQELVDGGMDVSLEGDAREIFRVVEKQNRQRTKATGYNSLAMAGG